MERVASVLAGLVVGIGAPSFGQDFEYTPVTPCRIVDTRIAVAGALAGGAARGFDLDGASFQDQGGSPTGCGIPPGIAKAVAMTIVAVQPAQDGFLTAWANGPRPLSSVLNYSANGVIAGMAIVPVAAGPAEDFTLFSLANTHVVVDVLGYFAVPIATRLDCITVLSETVLVPVGVPSVVTATCPADRTATGGGFDKAEGTASLVGVWAASAPFGNGWRALVENQSTGDRSVRSFVRCCRSPGLEPSAVRTPARAPR
jgi:hypothetical protein